ncbi:MAG: RDD family protein [Bdellovibrio sp.]
MVFPDLSAPEFKVNNYQKGKHPPIASVADRFLALVLDFFIFSPVISLLIAGLVRQTKTFFLISPNSQEGLIAFSLVMVMIVFFTTFLQAVFIYYWQATPGQAFLQLKVISYPDRQERLSLNQCWLRAFMWCTGLFLLGLPYLEIVSHPLRRAFHERASDTLVITLKRNHDDGPLPLESRFISSWLRMSFLFFLFFGALSFLKTYSALIKGDYRKETKLNAMACKEIPDGEAIVTNRLDLAISLFLLNEISPDCLDKEADALLWNDPVNSQGLAYLAKYLVGDSTVNQEKYFAKICADSHSSACVIANYLRADGKTAGLELSDKDLLTSRVLLSEEKYLHKDYDSSLKIIKELQSEPALRVALEKRYVRSIWSLREAELVRLKNKDRTPASTANGWLEKFKDEYEVP